MICSEEYMFFGEMAKWFIAPVLILLKTNDIIELFRSIKIHGITDKEQMGDTTSNSPWHLYQSMYIPSNGLSVESVQSLHHKRRKGEVAPLALIIKI